jgi:hypothetical protein
MGLTIGGNGWMDRKSESGMVRRLGCRMIDYQGAGAGVKTLLFGRERSDGISLL